MYALIYITTSGEKESKKIGKMLVEERLAGCVNIVSAIESIYWWEGNIEEDTESILIVKTKVSSVETIIKRVKGIHSYENPAILAIPIIGGSEDYLNWLESEISK